jgi:chromosome segregation ATPase
VISVETAVLLVVCVIAASAGVLFLFHRNHKRERRLADWLATMAASRAAARAYDLTCERDEARKRIDELVAQNSTTEAKYAAAREELRIERTSHEQTRVELRQVKASHAELKTCAMEATSKAVEFETRYFRQVRMHCSRGWEPRSSLPQRS